MWWEYIFYLFLEQVSMYFLGELLGLGKLAILGVLLNLTLILSKDQCHPT